MTSPEDFEILNKIRVMRQLKKKLKNNEGDAEKIKKKINSLENEIEEYIIDD